MDVSTKQRRIAEIAKRLPDISLTSLNHYLDMEWLYEAYRRVRKESAPGVDKVTVEEYGKRLEENLKSLLERAKSGRYVAPPVKRVHIPKGTGSKETRPIGLPTTEDKVLQRAVVMLLEPIYESEFFEFSYAYRPEKSTHQALEYLWEQIMKNRIGWILDIDIEKFFDSLDRAILREILCGRVRDGVIMRLIGKWLKAGVLEGYDLTYPEEGTVQGGVISPMLSNIYLHEVLDRWFAKEIRKRLRGGSFMVRFADDVVMGFEKKEDGERVLEVLHKRLGKYGLKLHAGKTRLVPFGRPEVVWGERRETSLKAGTFDFLGFTHYWGKSRKGRWVVKRKTAWKKFTRVLKSINEWCKENRHLPMREQHRRLSQKVRGHYAYYGVTGNGAWLERFREEVKKTWRKWLNRRSCSGKDMAWDRFGVLMREHFPLPPARVVHSVYAAKP